LPPKKTEIFIDSILAVKSSLKWSLSPMINDMKFMNRGRDISKVMESAETLDSSLGERFLSNGNSSLVILPLDPN